MRNIVLIEPKTEEGNLYKHIHMPRLGLPLLGTQLKKAGFEVSIYAATGGDLPWEALAGADLAGISTTTATAPEAYRIAAKLRSRKVPVVIGGIHATFMPDEALQHADYVVRGEADHSFLPLVQALAEGRTPEGVPGVSYWDGGEPVHNPYRPWEIDVKELPTPDLNLFVQGNPLQSPLGTIPMATSRGCPHNCTFCSVTPMFGRKYRHRRTGEILDELELYRGKSVFFCDDNFTANLRHTKELLRGMLARGIKLRSWGAQVRAEVAEDEEFLQLMKRTRGDKVYVGLESINPETLEAYNKEQSLEDISSCIGRFHDYKIRVHGMFVLGSDSDTARTVRDTVEFAQRLRIDSVQFMILTPLPGTPLFEKLEEEGRIFTRDWELFDGHHVVFEPAEMTPAELQQETYLAYKRFYGLRHVFKNFFLTGWESALYRAIGCWLVNRYDRDNRRYTEFLERCRNNPGVMPLFSKEVNLRQKDIPSKARDRAQARPQTAGERQFKIYITEAKGVFNIHLRGLLNRVSVKEFKQAVRNAMPRRYFKLEIHLEDVSFSSEKTARYFSSLLEKMEKRAGRQQVNRL